MLFGKDADAEGVLQIPGLQSRLDVYAQTRLPGGLGRPIPG